MKFFQISIFSLFTPKPAAQKRGESAPRNDRSRKTRGSDPHLKTIWIDLLRTYFPGREDLDDYLVNWSARRQKRTLASCNMTHRKVNVAREMRHPDCRQWLEPLLYHELCHAVLGKDLERESGRRPWHGREFRLIEKRHPRIAALNEWIKAGGWDLAKRRDRAARAWQRRRSEAA